MSTTPDDQNDSASRQATPGGDYPPPPAASAPTGSAGAYPPPPGSAGAYPPPPGSAGAYPPPPGSAGAYPPPPGSAGGYPPPPAYGQGPGGYPQAYGPGAPLSPSDQRLWAVLGHLGTLLLWFIAPLVVWLVFRGRGAFLEDHAKESLNFQITITIAAVALGFVSLLTLGIGALLYVPFGIIVLIFLIIAAVKASQGEPYRYPLTLRLVS